MGVMMCVSQVGERGCALLRCVWREIDETLTSCLADSKLSSRTCSHAHKKLKRKRGKRRRRRWESPQTSLWGFARKTRRWSGSLSFSLKRGCGCVGSQWGERRPKMLNWLAPDAKRSQLRSSPFQNRRNEKRKELDWINRSPVHPSTHPHTTLQLDIKESQKKRDEIVSGNFI